MVAVPAVPAVPAVAAVDHRLRCPAAGAGGHPLTSLATGTGPG